MPGLIRGVARTAAIAGTATAVSNRVSRRQAGRWASQEQQQYAQEPPPQQQYALPPPPPQTGMDDKLAQLKELGELKAAGVLSEPEFEQQKARIDEAVEAGEVEIVDHALVPGGPMGRGGTKRMLFALVVGLLIGGGGALLLDRMNTALVRRDDVEAFLHLPALGVIPRIEGAGAPAKKRIKLPDVPLLPRRAGAAEPAGALITVTDLHSSGSQAYRKLRTHLIFSTAGDPLRTLMVTSPAASTSTAS